MPHAHSPASHDISTEKGRDRATLRKSKADLRRKLAAEEGARAFFRLMSHELRTPLNAIIGFSEIIAYQLYGPISEPRYIEHAELIRESGHKLLSLVNQIMEIAKLESGAADLDLHQQPCGPPIFDAIRQIAGEARDRGVTLDLRIPSPEPELVCDHRALTQVLVNLIRNAVIFGPANASVVIEVAAEGRRVAIAVQDFGPGVAEEDLPRLMRPFEQGESALVRHASGAGLGLPTAYLLSKAMGGGLTLSSGEGEGLRAVVRLPAVLPKPRVINA
jgi:signal transduction histidine kinase